MVFMPIEVWETLVAIGYKSFSTENELCKVYLQVCLDLCKAYIYDKQ